MAMEQSGSAISLLHSSPMGKPIYEKIGFRQIGTAALTEYKPSQSVWNSPSGQKSFSVKQNKMYATET
jgi:hypothetical protein